MFRTPWGLARGLLMFRRPTHNTTILLFSRRIIMEESASRAKSTTIRLQIETAFFAGGSSRCLSVSRTITTLAPPAGARRGKTFLALVLSFSRGSRWRCSSSFRFRTLSTFRGPCRVGSRREAGVHHCRSQQLWPAALVF